MCVRSIPIWSYSRDSSGTMLQAFLANKFRRSRKPISEVTMQRLMLGVTNLSDSTLTLHEKQLLGRA